MRKTAQVSKPAGKTLSLNLDNMEVIDRGVAVSETNNTYIIVVSKTIAKHETKEFVKNGETIPSSTYWGTKSPKYCSKTEDGSVGFAIKIKHYDSDGVPQNVEDMSF
jgi:hypothetical protein